MSQEIAPVTLSHSMSLVITLTQDWAPPISHIPFITYTSHLSCSVVVFLHNAQLVHSLISSSFYSYSLVFRHATSLGYGPRNYLPVKTLDSTTPLTHICYQIPFISPIPFLHTPKHPHVHFRPADHLIPTITTNVPTDVNIHFWRHQEAYPWELPCLGAPCDGQASTHESLVHVHQ